MLASPSANKPQVPPLNVSEIISNHPHATLSLLSTQPFSSMQSPSFSQSLPEFSFRSSSKHVTSSTPSKDLCVDRFIPIRSDPVKRKLLFDLQEEPYPQTSEESFSSRRQQHNTYRLLLEEQILGLPRSTPHDDSTKDSFPQTKSPKRLFNFKSPCRDERYGSLQALHQTCFPFSCENIPITTPEPVRKIPDKPCRVLEAPYLEDDYYLNLLDWSNSNVVAVALRDTIYIWSGVDGIITRLNQMDSYSDIYTSVGWDPTGAYLAAGVSTGKLEIWDLDRMKVIRDDLEDHSGRIGCIGWNSNNILASGSMDNSIMLRDMRIRGPQSTVMKLKGHKYEVCGLKWSPNGLQLASGGNDNKLFIWNVRKGTSEARFGDHKAAVKAITWSPHQNGLLLSGGGNNDKTIKFWNTLTMKNVKSVYTASQVCNLTFSKNSNEFISTHGFNNNHVVIWKYPELTKVGVLEGHTSRVLYLGLSPDGETIVTGAGAADETLRFWSALPPVPQPDDSTLLPSSNNLR